MSEEKEYRTARKAEAANKHREAMRRDHRADRMIRKLDSSVPRLKELKQADPTNEELIPNAKIHKLTV